MFMDSKLVEQARNADMIAFLEKYHGYTFVQQRGAFRCRQHQSLAIKNDRLSFYWHSKGIGGFGAIDYLTKVENMSFREAVEVITGTTPKTAPPPQEMQKAEPPRTVILPEKKAFPLRLYDYLCMKRGIDVEIVDTLIQRKMLYEDMRGNLVFVGFDEQGAARFATVRSTYADFRGDCVGSDKRHGFKMVAVTPSARLYVFESALDAMSYASLENVYRDDVGAWKRSNYLSLAGTTDTAMPFFLNQYKAVKELIFCLDSDPTGRNTSIDLMRKYADKGYITRIEPPQRKDYNEDLQAFREHMRVQKRNNKSYHDISI
jgi:hypothetical protein